MKDCPLIIFIVIRKGSQIIDKREVYMTLQQFKNSPSNLEFKLSSTEENGRLMRQVVSTTIEKKSGVYSGVLTTTYLDRKAMKAKVCELEALLAEYGAQLNGSKHKYDAHLLSISEDKFTTTTTEEVEVLLDARRILFKQ